MTQNLKPSATRCPSASVCCYSRSSDCPDLPTGCMLSEQSKDHSTAPTTSKKQISEDIIELFESLRSEMLASLELDRKHILHSVCKGDASETKWRDFLRTYLPPRYKVDKGIVINSKGQISDQIDIIIYDAINAPFAFKHNDFLYIPIECVCAVFEVKQSMNAEQFKYTKEKIESVRKLVYDNIDRTNGIIGGFLSLESDLKRTDGYITDDQIKTYIEGNIKTNNPLQYIDYGCCLRDFSFANPYHISNASTTEDKNQDKSIIGVKYVRDKILVAFIFRLILLLDKKRYEKNTRHQTTETVTSREEISTKLYIAQYIEKLDIMFDRGTRALY